MEEGTQKRSLVSKIKKFLIGAGIGLVVFVVSILVLAFVSTRGVADAADAFIADLQAGECVTMYTNTTADFQDDLSEEEWLANCERISPILAGEPVKNSVQVEKSNQGDSRGIASYEIAGTDDITYIVTLLLLDEDGWKLSNIDSTPKDTQSE